MDNSKAVVKAEKSKLAIALESKQDTILSMLNKRLDLQYFMSTALLHVSEKEYTLEVAQKNPNSFVKAVVKAAEFGLSFSKGLAYLVPFKDSVVFIAGYQGLVQVMLRGQTRVHDIRARMVYENEVFEHLEGTNPQLVHKPLETPEERGAMRGAYAVAFFRDGNLPHPEYMPMCDLEKRREAAKKRNKGKESDAWIEWSEEMYLRPPVHKLFKFLPQTEEGQKVLAYEDELWGYDKEEEPYRKPGDRVRDRINAKKQEMAEDAHYQDIPPDGDKTNRLAEKLSAKPEPVLTPEETAYVESSIENLTKPVETYAPQESPQESPQKLEPERTNDRQPTGHVKALLDKMAQKEVTITILRKVATECGVKHFSVPQNLTEEEAGRILEKL